MGQHGDPIALIHPHVDQARTKVLDPDQQLPVGDGYPLVTTFLQERGFIAKTGR